MFNCRVIKYRWKTADLLAKYSNSIVHPAAVGMLIGFSNMYVTKDFRYNIINK